MLRMGTVVAQEGEAQITVEFDRPEACNECGQCGGERHAHRITIAGQAAVGDWVSVEMPDQKVVQASLLAYVIPLALLLAGLLLAGVIQPAVAPRMSADLFAVLCVAAALAVAFSVLHIVDRRIRGKRQWTPQIVEVMPAGTHESGESLHKNS